jgi:3'5'-cyclic nucleotide phosphodiesterase/Adenylate and Guanylate cyclase catalytic domain
VTAGVLRGERSRFQLFGDTMNTASRMESTGKRDKIHLSEETAKLLVAAGKSSWIAPREDKVVAKGKGEMNTYWLVSKHDPPVVSTPAAISPKPVVNQQQQEISIDGADCLEEKTTRSVKWHVELQLSFLRQMVSNRRALSRTSRSRTNVQVEVGTWFTASQATTRHQTILDEARDIIHIEHNSVVRSLGTDDVELDPAIEAQLTHYISRIAYSYRNNPFHNFEHASHVTMSVMKLLSRTSEPVAHPSLTLQETLVPDECDQLVVQAIKSDPLLKFACVFSAMIHDVDHPGVPNLQLQHENKTLADRYRQKSIAEQNSVTVAWDMLLESHYSELRNCIAPTLPEQQRFRQLVVNSVMATDIMDKDLKKLRNDRWDQAFHSRGSGSLQDIVDRKATIVIEHLIQASDVAHTMQHWHIYIRWNERLLEEMYQAYVDGRSDTDPCNDWFVNELGFLDHYVIPLAKKLKDCGVFGVSSSEYLDYAVRNRNELESRGKSIEEIISSVKSKVKPNKLID